MKNKEGIKANIDKNNSKEITKEQIIELFNKNIRGNKYDIKNKRHCGEEGHWLETQMNIKINCNNATDIGGYEMKKNSRKISFGDWSGTYLFSRNKKLLVDINKELISMSKEEFIKYFGNKTNKEHPNRWSWSGSCVPTYDKWNNAGQCLKIDDDKNILAMYSYEHDKRANLSDKFKNKTICIAIWSKTKMEKHINNKFNQKGFIICKKDKNNIYNKICFGPPITFDLFIEKIKDKTIYLDSGMYFDLNKPNTRLYSQWRAGNNFWNKLIIEES